MAPFDNRFIGPQVYKAKDLSTGKFVALKKTRLEVHSSSSCCFDFQNWSRSLADGRGGGSIDDAARGLAVADAGGEQPHRQVGSFALSSTEQPHQESNRRLLTVEHAEENGKACLYLVSVDGCGQCAHTRPLRAGLRVPQRRLEKVDGQERKGPRLPSATGDGEGGQLRRDAVSSSFEKSNAGCSS